MKRLAAVFLALLCTLLVPFPVALASTPVAKRCACCCADHPCNGCERGSCALPPAPAVVFAFGETSIAVSSRETRRRDTPAHVAVEKFYAAYARTLVPAAPSVPPRAVRPASAPLFQAHCSWLI